MNDLKDRRNLQTALNDIKEKFHSTKNEMDKLGTSTPEQKARLRELALAKAKQLIGQSDDLNKLNLGETVTIGGAKVNPPNPNEIIATIPGVTDKINTKPMMKEITGGDFINKLEALKRGGKKLAGVLPFAGAGMAALSGDPAMAAEEAAGDIPVAGQVYEALKSESAGQSPEDEKIMLAEDAARKSYNESPARLNRFKMDKLKAMISRDPASVVQQIAPEKAEALTGIDQQKQLEDLQLQKDIQSDPSMQDKNVRLKKLFQNQLSKNRNRTE